MLPVSMHHVPKQQTDFDKMSTRALYYNNRHVTFYIDLSGHYNKTYITLCLNKNCTFYGKRFNIKSVHDMTWHKSVQGKGKDHPRRGHEALEGE